MEESIFHYQVTGRDTLLSVNMEEEDVAEARPTVASVNTGDLLNISQQLALAVADLTQQVQGQQKHIPVIYTCPAPTIRKFTGSSDSEDLQEWIKEARVFLGRVGLTGEGAVTHLCGFLENPALRRVRNCKVENPEDLFTCLETAFGSKFTYIELETLLQERMQGLNEGVWEFMDVLRGLEAKLQQIRPRSLDDRKWFLVTWFCRNLRDRKIGVKSQKWWDENPSGAIDSFVQRVDEKIREAERIKMEERELLQPRRAGGVVRGLHGIPPPKPPCNFCGIVGHLGYQCEMFPGKSSVKKFSGNEQL